MRIQHENAGWVPEDEQAPAAPARVEPEEEFGFVAVAAGEGLNNVFKDIDVDYVISGGQTMNPSANDIATACDAVKAKTVFVCRCFSVKILPNFRISNSKNI